jgi:hypothetical protein
MTENKVHTHIRYVFERSASRSTPIPTRFMGSSDGVSHFLLEGPASGLLQREGRSSMLKILVAEAALAVGLAGYAVAQEAAPATPAAPAAAAEQHLPPHHPLRRMPPHHPLRRMPPHHPLRQHAAPTAPAETPKP